MDAAQIASDAAQSTFNIAELENVDLGSGANSHLLAATRYQDWRHRDVLIQDEVPSLYLHEHSYRDGERRRHRRGLLARVRLADWSERVILPHEGTIPGPRLERLARLRAVRANLSPLYLLYHDESGDLHQTLTTAIAGAPPISSGVDIKGDRHRLTRIDNDGVGQTVSEFFSNRTLFVADGHHRYEAALAYRDERRRAGSGDTAPSEYVLAMLADINDPGVSVRPTHRVINRLAGFDVVDFRRQLAELFVVETSETPVAVSGDNLICELVIAGEKHPWRVSPRQDRSHEARLPPSRSRAWRDLNVAIADSIMLESIFGLGSSRLPNHVSYTHDANVAREEVGKGEAQLAMIFAPPSLLALARVAEAGDKLPPKSSYFDPKPPAGLVINDLSEL